MAAHSNSYPSHIPLRTASGSRTAGVAGLVLALIGVAAFFLAPHERAWSAFHFNWMFWSSVAIGMCLFAVALHLTNARWAWSIKRFPLGGVAFLPVSFVLFIPLMLGGKDVFFHHWIHGTHGDAVLEAKAAWLNFGGMMARDVAALVVLYGMVTWFAYHQLRADVHGLDRAGRRSWAYGFLTGNAKNARVEDIARESQDKALFIGVFTALAFAFLWGLIGIDVAMTTLPHFFSTMFPVAFFTSAFHSALAMTVVMIVVYRGPLRLEKFIGPQQFHDIGKLLFAFAVFWMYVNWSQYVVIWYGLLPAEQNYFVLKFTRPYAPLVLAAVMMIFVLPFFGLLARAVKKVPGILAGFAVIILAGHWLERFLIATPNYWEAEKWGQAGIGIPEVGIAIGFLGLFVACYSWYMATFPILPSPVTLAAAPSATVTVGGSPKIAEA